MKIRPTPSKMLTLGALALFLATLALSFGSVLTGCNSNTGSLQGITDQDDVDFFELSYDPVELAKRNVTVDAVDTFEALITVAEGGVILLVEPDVVTGVEALETLDGVNTSTETCDAFIIQPFSITDNTLIRFEVTKYVTTDGDVPIIFDCHPDGLVFSIPAILLINAWEDFGKKTQSVCFYYLNEVTNKWELLEEVAVVNGLAATDKIAHFSRYGVGKGGTAAAPGQN